MNIVLGGLVVLVASSLAITAMLLARRRAPEGGYFANGDRAAGVFGVLATGFSVLLGFLIFLSFESYDASRAGAEEEALTVAQQVETAQLLPEPAADEMTGALVCYARFVVHSEWDAMEDGTLGEQFNPWGAEMFQVTDSMEPETASEEAAFVKWLDQTSERESARQDRIHGAVGVIPTPLWIVLFFISGIVVIYLLAFADSGERAPIQGLYMGTVVSVIVAMLLLLNFLDDPIHDGIGGLQPVAMERALVHIDDALVVSGTEATIPCDESGRRSG